MKVKVLATGSYAPDKILRNADLQKMVETTDPWILERTGIRERHIAAPEQCTSDLGAEAARRALESAEVAPGDVDTILLATSSPDRVVPPTAVYIQAKLGCWNAGCCDITAACSGFTYGLTAGRAYVASGQSRRCLVIGAEILSRVTNYKDRTTCILFGDGAGAVLLGPSDGGSDFLYTRTGGDGRLATLIIAPAGGTALMPSPETLAQDLQYIQMKGREVYKYAVPKFVGLVTEAVRSCSLKLPDITHFIPHQMNARMIEAVCERLPFPMERVVMNVDRYGNTSAASIPIALDEAVRAGRIKRGDLVLMSAMGAGITWGTAILKW